MQDIYAVVDSVGVCAFVAMRHLLDHDRGLALTRMARVLSAATGESYDPESLLLAGERIYNLERLFLNRAGFDRAQDTLPPRMLKEPMPEGPAQGQVVELEEMLEEYYLHRGWSPEGRPLQATLSRLGIED